MKILLKMIDVLEDYKMIFVCLTRKLFLTNMLGILSKIADALRLFK